jgi:hypothetical protein
MTTCRWCQLDSRRGYHSEDWCACLGPPFRYVSVDSVYMRGACAKCARFRARWDSGKCEWCSRPWRPRPKKKPRKAIR